jgi:hypothetical protein
MKRLVQLGCIGVLASATVLGGRAQELSPGPPTLPAGLVRAFGEIGQNILGASNFFSLNPGPPDARDLRYRHAHLSSGAQRAAGAPRRCQPAWRGYRRHRGPIPVDEALKRLEQVSPGFVEWAASLSAREQ